MIWPMRNGTVWLVSVAVLLLGGQASAQSEIPKRYTETLKDANLNFEMVLIPGGKFLMGSSEDEAGRQDNEGPAHEVEIKPFYLCTTETSLELFIKYYEETVRPAEQEENPDDSTAKDLDAVTGPTPVYGDLTMGWGMEGRPAIAMTWENAVCYCRWLSEKTGKKYRLPAEAEWEYACRAGATTSRFFGDDPAELADYAWFEGNSDEGTHPAAQKKPNPWGLYDMLGNVREWVHDFYDPEYYAKTAGENPIRDPKGPEEGTVHVARGGAWDSPADELRSAARGYEEDFWRIYDPQWPKSKWWLPKCGFIGLRVARSVEE